MRRWVWIAIACVALVLAATAFGSGRPSATPPPGSGESGRATAQHLTATPSAPLPEPSSDSSSAAVSPSAPSPGADIPLAALLAMLRIAPEDRTGYSRSLFVHWIDADGDGCDTRHEVLIEESIVRLTVGPGCTLAGGRWISRYDDVTVTDPSKLQIDHVVALAEAWDSGASTWTAARREAFANDLNARFVLIAVSASSNQSKSDKDPADWLPPAADDECQFLGAWIATKVRWDLTSDQREHDALAADLTACPAATMPYLPAASVGETEKPGTGGTTTSPAPGGGCDPAYPTVCIPAPPPDLDCGDIAFRDFTVLAPDPHRFDGDHDGIGCET